MTMEGGAIQQKKGPRRLHWSERLMGAGTSFVKTTVSSSKGLAKGAFSATINNATKVVSGATSLVARGSTPSSGGEESKDAMDASQFK